MLKVNSAANKIEASNNAYISTLYGTGINWNGNMYINIANSNMFEFRNMNGNTQFVLYGLHAWIFWGSGAGFYMSGQSVYVNNNSGMGLITTSLGSQSDDRLKFSETSMTYDRAASLLRLIPILEYEKVQHLMTAEEEATFASGGDGFASRKEVNPELPASHFDHVHEAGTIAQRLQGTDAEFLVSVGNDETPYCVKYDQITSINTRVLQGLLDKIDALTARVAALESA